MTEIIALVIRNQKTLKIIPWWVNEQVKFKVFNPYKRKLVREMELSQRVILCVNDLNKNIRLIQGNEIMAK